MIQYSACDKRSNKRELGLVETLVGSYGFANYFDRDGRLFFLAHAQLSVSSGPTEIDDRVRLIAQEMGNELNVPVGTFYARHLELAHAGSNNPDIRKGFI